MRLPSFRHNPLFWICIIFIVVALVGGFAFIEAFNVPAEVFGLILIWFVGGITLGFVLPIYIAVHVLRKPLDGATPVSNRGLKAGLAIGFAVFMGLGIINAIFELLSY